MFTLISRRGDTSPLLSVWLAPIASSVASFWSRCCQKRHARLMRAELQALDDRMLKDIGLQRLEIESALLHGERFGWYAARRCGLGGVADTTITPHDDRTQPGRQARQ